MKQLWFDYNHMCYKKPLSHVQIHLEMEYFPMEVEMTGVRSNDKLFSVHDFEIKYIQGCDEQ